MPTTKTKSKASQLEKGGVDADGYRMSKLPKGWRRTSLESVCTIAYGKTLPTSKFTEEGYPVYGANGIIGKYPEYRYEDEQVLISCRGAYSGKINLSPPKAFITNNSLILELPEDASVDKRYLFYCLHTADKTKLVTGSAQPQVTINNAKVLELPIAPLPEQRRIVARIEELFSLLDAGVAALHHAKAQLQRYRQSVLAAAVTGELTKEWREQHPDTVPAVELRKRIHEERQAHYRQQLIDTQTALKIWEHNGRKGKKPTRLAKLKNGARVNSTEIKDFRKLPTSWTWERLSDVTYRIGDIDHKMPKDAPEGLPYLSTSNLKKNGTIDFANSKTISREDFDMLSLKIKPEENDIIFPRYGTIGRNFFIDFNKEFLVSYSCAIIKNVTQHMCPKYVFYYSLSEVVQKEIARYVVQTTQANIGIASLEKFVFPLPPLAEQHQIVAEVEARTTAIDHLEAELDRQITRSNRLRQAILRSAFSGCL